MSDTTDTTGTSGIPTGSVDAAPAPLLQMLQLPGLSEADGDVPVCGPDGCAVPVPAASAAPAAPSTPEQH
jgi:hypothetical protein